MEHNLYLFAKEYERFHLQRGKPVAKRWGTPYLFERTKWSNVKYADGTQASFSAYVLLYFIRWYWGEAKCDGTRTRMYWAGHLHPEGAPGDPRFVVMTTTEKEKAAFRLSAKKPNHYRWDNMGGI